MSGMKLVLSFENGRWRARGADVDVAHAELGGLEALLEAELASERPFDVELAFDMAALPRWLHQYHAHYMNYTLRVPGRSARA